MAVGHMVQQFESTPLSGHSNCTALYATREATLEIAAWARHVYAKRGSTAQWPIDLGDAFPFAPVVLSHFVILRLLLQSLHNRV